jgi:hypothetical protein
MSYAETCKFTRGGRRPGSGRKKLYRVPVLLRISKEHGARLRLAAQRFNSTPSRVVEQLIDAIKLPPERTHLPQDAF